MTTMLAIADADFIVIVLGSNSLSQVATAIRKSERGGYSHYAILNRIRRLNIDITHFLRRSSKGRKAWNRKPIESYLILGRKIEDAIKKRLISEGLLKNQCAICDLGSIWHGRKLVLQLDHKNGNKTDSRFENLRLLCPNCHTQTETWGSRRLKKPRAPYDRRKPKPHTRKVLRPTKHELEVLLRTQNWSAIGRKYGVTDNAVRKWAHSYGIPVIRRWTNKKSAA